MPRVLTWGGGAAPARLPGGNPRSAPPPREGGTRRAHPWRGLCACSAGAGPGMAAVLELLLQEEVPVSAVVRWLRHGPGHRTAEVTRARSSARSALAPAGPGLEPRHSPSTLRCRGPGPCGKVCPPRAAVRGEARVDQPGAPSGAVPRPSVCRAAGGTAPGAGGLRSRRREGEAAGGSCAGSCLAGM